MVYIYLFRPHFISFNVLQFSPSPSVYVFATFQDIAKLFSKNILLVWIPLGVYRSVFYFTSSQINASIRFFNCLQLIGMTSYLTIALICISLSPWKDEHFFMLIRDYDFLFCKLFVYSYLWPIFLLGYFSLIDS